MHIHRSITLAIRVNQTWDERWKDEDAGLIACWERGREKSAEDEKLAERARNDELVLLPWKGGINKALKSGHKYGTLRYLAMWQGLRSDDLNIRLDQEVTLVCSRTKMRITYTHVYKKYATTV